MKKVIMALAVAASIVLGSQMANASGERDFFIQNKIVRNDVQEGQSRALEVRASRIEQICQQYKQDGKECPYKQGEPADISQRERNEVKGGDRFDSYITEEKKDG